MSRKNYGSLRKYSLALPFFTIICACDSGPVVEKMEGKAPQLVEEFVQNQVSQNWDEISGISAKIPLQMYVRVGSATDPTVCTTGELYGPFAIEDNSIGEEASIKATQPTLRLANLGDLAICSIITSPVNASLDVTADTLYMNNEECTVPPASIAGVWEGSYSCTSSCGSDSGTVSLTIVQDEYSATYSDGEASYEGTVCGNEFDYSGGGPGYTESGTFVLNSDGSASKTSSYQSTVDSCTGTCSDPYLILQ